MPFVFSVAAGMPKSKRELVYLTYPAELEVDAEIVCGAAGLSKQWWQ